MINLNDESFDQKQGKVIFNGGVAGIVEPVVMALVKKTPEDNANAPEYKIVFKDSKGGECNMSFWTVKEATAYKTTDELIAAQGKVLKHLLHAVYGADFKIPNFENASEMLAGSMKLIHQGITGKNIQFRILTTYGTVSAPKKYIQPRSWVPFIESVAIPLTETRLETSTFDQMEKISTDTPSTSAGSTTTVSTDDW
jgi:hypothetical protein